MQRCFQPGRALGLTWPLFSLEKPPPMRYRQRKRRSSLTSAKLRQKSAELPLAPSLAQNWPERRLAASRSPAKGNAGACRSGSTRALSLARERLPDKRLKTGQLRPDFKTPEPHNDRLDLGEANGIAVAVGAEKEASCRAGRVDGQHRRRKYSGRVQQREHYRAAVARTVPRLSRSDAPPRSSASAVGFNRLGCCCLSGCRICGRCKKR